MKIRLLLTTTLLLSLTGALQAQYSLTHYIAPSPWYYFDQANEIVVSTESASAINVTISNSAPTQLTVVSVSVGNPVRYRFANPGCGAGCTPAYNINTLYAAGAGIIVTAPSPVAVSIRNVESDQIGGGNPANIKGNASLSSFGDQGQGIEFRLGYYRTDFTGLRAQGGGIAAPVYSVMAIANNTQVFLNGANLVTLNAGESYLFQGAIGSLLESTKPVVVNSGQWRDTPTGCGDAVVSQVFPVSIAGSTYLVVRGSGTAGTGNTALPEQSTIIATQDGGTNVTVTNYNATGASVSTTTYTLAAGGNFQTIYHGDGTNVYSSSYITSSKPVIVYSGTAQGCEVDMAMTPPLLGCTGSLRVETIKFRNYTDVDLPYFGFVAVQSATTPVFLNGVNLETLSGNTRFQIGNTGYYLIQFTNVQIGTPVNLVVTSIARMSVSIVQQGGGFSMAGFYSSFNETPIVPTISGSGLCTNVVLTAEAGLSPYQWFYEGDLIPGATGQTYTPTQAGNYAVAGTRTCGTTAPSPVMTVACTSQCPTGYEPSPNNISINGNFATQGGAVGGGILCAQSPVSTNGTLNATSLFFSQAAHCTDGARAADGCNGAGRNQYSLMSGSFPFNNFGFSDLLNIFPGDPTNNVPASSTYLYSNGNCFNGAEYLIWGQTLTGLTVGQTYTFYCYGNNAIEPPGNATDDPIIRLRIGGSQSLPNGVAVAGPLTLTETLCASTQPLGGWQRLAYTFVATSTSIVVKITSSATGSVGDDFQLTSAALVPCRPALTASSNSPGCTGGAINLSANTSTSNTLTYAWSGPNSFSSALSNPTISNATTAMAGTYTVTVSDASGITNTASTTVVVNISPTAGFSVNSNAQCFTGNNFVFTNSSVAGSGTITGFSWSFGAGASLATASTVGPHTVTYSTTGTKVINLTVTNSNGCTATSTINVTVNPQPVASFTVNSNVQCFSGNSFVYSNTSTGGNTYAWDFGSGASPSSATNFGPNTVTYSTTGTKNVVLTVTSAFGCTNTAAQNVTVSLTPSITLASPAFNGVNVACFGGSTASINTTVTGGAGPFGYLWNGPTSIPANTANPSSLRAGNYTVTVSNASGCTATGAIALTQPAQTLTAGSCTPATDRCQLKTGQFQIQAQGGTPPYNVAWTPNNGSPTSPGAIVLSGGTITISSLQGGVLYNFTVTDANGCIAP